MTVALIDANVLYMASVRDLLLWLAADELYSPRWTNAIHAEWTRNVIENHPGADPNRLERTRRMMDQIDPACLVQEFDHLIPALTLPDAGDRHVLAAAIHSGSDILVTYNLRDFPSAVLETYGIRPIHPDGFLCEILDSYPARFVRAARTHRSNLQRPTKSVEDYLHTLRDRGLTILVTRLASHAEDL